jgi:glutaredoxin
MLESLLSTNNIQFTQCDIDADSGCRTKYEKLGVKEVPVAKVGDQVIVGMDISKISAALTGSKPESIESIFKKPTP